MSQAKKIEELNNKEKATIFNIPIGWFLIILSITLFAMYTGNLPAGMVGALLIMMVLGEFFGWIGDTTPILRGYLGGGAILAIFGSAFLAHMNLMPEETTGMIADFMQVSGFLNFYIAGLITGSILGIDSRILLKVGSRIAIPLLAGVATAVLLAGTAGFLVGDGFIHTILIIALPLMGGGMGLGGVPLSQLYSDILGNDPSYYISLLVPAIALGNLFAIVAASVLNGIGKKYPHLTGNGEMIPGFHVKKRKTNYSLNQLGIGLLVGMLFFAISSILGEFIPLHPFALMIILLTICKTFDILPQMMVDGANGWYQFVLKNWTFALLVGIGITFTDLHVIINAFTLEFIIIVGSIVIGVTLATGFVGKLVGFYPIEAAISTGLGMVNMGGTGDVSVLAAAKRMELMAFCQISSTLGASLILFLANIFAKLL
ncbi:2-hydroxycarboxylate transporter family protein [Oceanobacillus saliphilus]|uniref:2-hydroxycarboxylate transporter family protein n=1 Tax=Oceanobacillus saliphilus TaxID=2925834 RepID=UPI00201DB572|nr:2-hydroxycarboxylate transporter family protein [Oceanobacillus saliphilus]